jgi:hypothetical protein
MLDCGHEPSPHSSFTTGYGENREGKKFCYDCCAEKEKEVMRKEGKTFLYIIFKDSIPSEVTDWHGYLRFPIKYWTVGKHNFCGKRGDVWFNFEGYVWHGVHMGDMNEIIHCKRTKEKVCTTF